MSESLISIPDQVAQKAYINEKQYHELYQRSLQDPKGFWAAQAQEMLDWQKPFSKVLDYDYNQAKIEWFVQIEDHDVL